MLTKSWTNYLAVAWVLVRSALEADEWDGEAVHDGLWLLRINQSGTRE